MRLDGGPRTQCPCKSSSFFPPNFCLKKIDFHIIFTLIVKNKKYNIFTDF